MKTIPEGKTTRSKLGSIINVAAALVVAVYALLILSGFIIAWTPSSFGDFGLTIGEAFYGGTRVSTVDPDSPADKAGIKPGDTVERPATLRDRLLLTGLVLPRPGERITFSTARGDERRTLTLQAVRAARLSTIDSVGTILLLVTLFLYVFVGLALVVLRPSRITWGFCLFAYFFVMLTSSYGWGTVPQNIPAVWLVALTVPGDFLVAAGIVGFLIFCLRFPANAPTSWQRAIDNSTPYLAAALAAVFTARDLAANDFAPDRVTSSLNHVLNFGALALFAVGIIVLLINYLNARGLERHRIKWVVLGLACYFVATAAHLILGEALPSWPNSVDYSLTLLYIPLPLAVAYAVIRHRVIDIHFVLGRSLVIGVIATVVALVFIGADWLFSTKLSSSRLNTAVYAAIALLAGLSLGPAWRKISRMVDALFFRQWHRTQEQASTLADALRGAQSKPDLNESLVTGVATAFSLASAAIFERAEGGGFVRTAALGWPTGTLWHILPDDPPARRVAEGSRVVDMDAFRWNENDLPSGVARPAIMVPIPAGKLVSAILLYGAHENGTSLDPDEIRIIRRLATDAGFLYSDVTADTKRSSFLEPQRGPLGV